MVSVKLLRDILSNGLRQLFTPSHDSPVRSVHPPIIHVNINSSAYVLHKDLLLIADMEEDTILVFCYMIGFLFAAIGLFVCAHILDKLSSGEGNV